MSEATGQAVTRKTSETIKDPPQQLLQQLRDENAKRWKLIEDLHEQLVARADKEEEEDGDDSDDENELLAKHPGNQILDSIQVEIDLLPQNGVYAKCDELLNHLEGSPLLPTTELEDAFAAEVILSTRQVAQTDQVLKEAIQREQEKLEAMQTSIAEQTAIQKKLKELEGNATFLTGTSAAAAAAAAERPTDSGQQKNEQELNQQLKEALRYLTEYIDQQCERGKAAQQQNSDTPAMRLDELISKLLERAIASPEDPYISVSDDRIQPKHVELLRQCWMVQSFKDDESLIRLVDYHI